MERWRGRVAVVTGASAGIGSAIAYQLQDAGLDVVALARRVDKIHGAVEAARKGASERGRAQLGVGDGVNPGKIYYLKCDVSKEEDILNTFKWIKENVGKVDVLVNNAGVPSQSKLAEAPAEEWKRVLDTNVLGLCICTREAIRLMKEKDIEDGHIIHIGSSWGHGMPPATEFAMYSASKHAVRVLTEGLRKELVAAKSKIRVTEVSPGLVKTEIMNAIEFADPEVVYQNPHLLPEDVADCVLYALSTPPHVQIHEIFLRPVGEQ